MPSRVVTGSASRAEATAIVQENVATALRMIDAALSDPATSDSRLLLLPEFAFQGPPLKENVPEWIDLAADTLPGAISAPLQEKAREAGVYIAGNQFEYDPEWPGRHFNCSFVIDPSGEIILRYRRIYTAQWPSPHDMMDAYLERYGIEGTFPVVDTELGRLAIFPCGEVSAPEAARMFMLRGAEILLHPDNGGVNAAGDALMVARAYENMLFFVSTNVAGPIGFAQNGKPLGGHSMIVDFDGNVLASEMSAEPTTSVSAVLDLEALRTARRDPTMRNRLLRSRFQIYRPIYEQAEFYPANAFAETPMGDWRETAPVVEAALANMVRHGVTTPVGEPVAAS
jgi:predicted amidohydrolase